MLLMDRKMSLHFDLFELRFELKVSFNKKISFTYLKLFKAQLFSEKQF